MKIDPVVVRLALIFLPGIVWYAVADSLTTHRDRSSLQVVGRAFVFGIAAYVLVGFMEQVHCFLLNQCRVMPPWCVPTPIPVLRSTIETPSGARLLSTTVVAFFAALLWSAAANHTLLYRLMRLLRITQKHGHEDVWNYVMNRPDDELEYVWVRDFENEFTYCGWITSYSGAAELRELFLEDVIIRSDRTGSDMASVPAVYLARSRDELVVEFPLRTGKKESSDAGQEGQPSQEGRSEPKQPAPQPGRDAEVSTVESSIAAESVDAEAVEPTAEPASETVE